MSIYNYQFSPTQGSLERIRDVFCFCCFTSLRYSDVYNLKRININKDIMRITTIKTVTSITIELNQYSQAILAKYQDNIYPDNKALPVVYHTKMNESLKVIGKLCNINSNVEQIYYKGSERIENICPKYELISTHTARRTFICNALAMGIPPHIVMKWTGHSNYASMQPYIGIADKETLFEMNKFNEMV